MAIPRVYITGGTISCASGADSFTGTGTLFAQADLEGAQLLVFPGSTGEVTPFLVGIVEAIDPRYPEETYDNLGPVPLVHSYEGPDIVDESRYVLLLSPAIVANVTVSAILARFIAHLEDNAGLVYTDSAELDYALVEDNSIVIDATTRQIKRWKNGILETIFAVSLAFHPRGPWVGDPESKTDLAITTGNVVNINFNNGALDDDGRAHFDLLVDDDFTLQPPSNVEAGDVFDILFTIGGGTPHVIAGDAVYTTDISTLIRATTGDRTRLRFSVAAAGTTSGIATEVSVAAVTFSENDLVEDGGEIYVSNLDDNDEEPQTDTNGAISDANWTVLPGTPGADGDPGEPGSSDVVGTSASSVSIGTGAKSFTVVESDRGWGIGARLRISSDASPTTHWMEGVVTSYSGSSLQVTVDLIAGSGSRADWTINLAGNPGEDGTDGTDGDDGAPGADGTDPGILLTWDTGTADADPGAGEIRADNASLASATFLYVNKANRAGSSIAAYLLALAGSDNPTHKGTIILTRSSDEAQATFAFSAVADATGYVKLAISSHSGATSFTAADAISFQFSRTGNKGSDGAGAGTVTNSANLGNNEIVLGDGGTAGVKTTGVAISTDATLAANSNSKMPTEQAVKGYVDGLALNLGKRARVRSATTANITIATALNNGDTLDGVTLATGDLVLVKDQSAPAENGVYVVGVSPARSSEFDSYNEYPGSLISVAEGTANADTLWLCTSNEGGTLGTTAIAFSRLVIAGELLAANNLSDVANAATAFGNIKQAASLTATGVAEIATAAEYRTGTDTARVLGVDEVWNAAEVATLTDAATITVDLAAGINFGGAANAVLGLGGNRTLGAPSNVKSGQSGILWFGALTSTRTLTLNAAWLLFDGVEVGPYSITTAQILGLAYVTRGTSVFVTSILRRAA
jgi:hypothetical protein